jgi:primosomal protein N' (replication factor Y)
MSAGTGSDESPVGEQLSLVRAAVRPVDGRRRLPSTTEPATVDPVAEVLVDVGLAHLDRPFEYLVPQSLADKALPGTRVKVRFAGQDVDGFVIARRAEAEHTGRLAPLRRVVSAEPVLTPTLLSVCREVAARYAGTVGDVLRLAVPPRHATAEKNLSLEPPEPEARDTAEGAAGDPGDDGPWSRYPAGPSFLRRVAAGEAPAASWLALPGTGGAVGAERGGGAEPGTAAGADWPSAFAAAAAAAVEGGRGALLVVPDHRDVDRVDAALRARLGKDRHVRLTADQGPQARYTAWLKVLRGHVPVVVGTRAAMFAPVQRLGLVAWWDDGDDLLVEPRSPYPHVREVLRVRARLEGAALLAGGYTRTTPLQQWVEEDALRPVAADPARVRRDVPRVLVAGEGAELERDPAAASAHLPSVAHRTAKRALEEGPVLIQVPRRGYVPSLSCQNCRRPARCGRCHGPLALTGAGATPTCRWCGTAAPGFECPECGDHRLRSSVVGARRTAEELGRAFAGVLVHTSGAGEVLATVGPEPSLVIATPGAEPVAEDGYAATLLLDAWALLDRPSLDAGEEALRRWMAAAALTRGAGRSGIAVLCGVPAHTTLPVVEALVRWDPAWFAGRELAERRELGLPPTVRMAQLVATRHTLEAALGQVELPDDIERLGPMPAPSGGPGRGGAPAGPDDPPKQQLLLRAPLAAQDRLLTALRDLRAIRSARKEPETVTVRVDPLTGPG